MVATLEWYHWIAAEFRDHVAIFCEVQLAGSCEPSRRQAACLDRSGRTTEKIDMPRPLKAMMVVMMDTCK